MDLCPARRSTLWPSLNFLVQVLTVLLLVLDGVHDTMYLNKLPRAIYINEFFRATAELLEADNMSLTRRIYNLNGITISPGELVKEIKK